MNRDQAIDGRISAWLSDAAPDQVPDVVLFSAFEQVRQTRQVRAIPIWRISVMNRRSIQLVAGAAAAVLILGVAALLGNGPSTGGPPSPTPIAGAAGQIVFERTVDGNTDLYLQDVDGTGVQRLTTDPADDLAPSWSHDGARIVFTRGTGEERDIYVMNADGSGQARLTSSPEGEDTAAFSPDDSQIVFLRYVDPDFFDIWIMGADGENARMLLHRDNVFAGDPRWAKDPGTIFFGTDEGSGLDIARFDIATGIVTAIVDDPGDDSTFDISPDASTIAFQSDREPGGIFLADIDGSNIRHLTGDWRKGYPLSWAPDGGHLAYAGADGWIYLVNADGSGVTKWTEGRHGLEWRPRT